ncbi:glycosyltransferase family 2 protein [Geodermatophilus sp. SYSU D01180]
MIGEWPYLAPPGESLSPPQRVSVGVLVTAHNVAAHLPAALESVFAQTRPADQVVVCDDASSDDVERALRPFGDRVRLVRHSVQRGEGAAKNTAVAALDTDLVVVLDGDDEMDPRRLEALAWLAARRPDLSLLTTTWEDFGPGMEPTEWSLADHFPTADQRAEILRWNFLPAPAMRRTALLEAGGFDETLRYGPDWECYVRMFLRGASAGLVPLPLYRYRRWAGQQTADRERVLVGRVRVAELIAANGSLRPADRSIADRSLWQLRYEYWTWRLDQGVATRRESLALLRCRRSSRRRTALLTLATLAPRVARRWRAR